MTILRNNTGSHCRLTSRTPYLQEILMTIQIQLMGSALQFNSPANIQTLQYAAEIDSPNEPAYHPLVPTDDGSRYGHAGLETPHNVPNQQSLNNVTGYEVRFQQSPDPNPQTISSHFYDVSSTEQKQKPVRATWACNFCRQSKARCDEGRPGCQNCRDSGLNCDSTAICLF